MDADKDRPETPPPDRGRPADAWAPPERHATFSRNRAMLAVLVIVAICVVVFAVALALR